MHVIKGGFSWLPIVAMSILSGCATTTTQLRAVSSEAVRAEEGKQREFVLNGFVDEQKRLYDVAYPLLRDARPLCQKNTAPKIGASFVTASSYKGVWRTAAYSVGLSDSVTVTAVAAASAAERGGLRKGDRIVAIGSTAIPTGPSGIKAVSSNLATQLAQRSGSIEVAIVRDGARTLVPLTADTTCAYDVAVLQEDIVNAFADGKTVFVTSGMMRFANDEELAAVVSHEIAHNAMGHIQAKQRNAGLGALFGAILDVAAATQGVNTQGDFTNQFAALGAMSFSQDFEREADYVGMYILAQNGRTLDRAPYLWRKMAQASPGSIQFASSHPTSAERYIRLDDAAKEIKDKRDRGAPLMPEMKVKK